jgi:hypothetical protein
VVDATKDRKDGREALRIAREASEIVVARRGKVVRLRMGKDAPTDAELRALVLGPTGNLRAPTMRIGRRLLIGFDEAAFREAFG